MIRKGLICSLAATSLSSLPSAIGFASTTPRAGVTVSSPSSPSSSTSLCGGISKWNEEYNMDADAEDEEELITKESNSLLSRMFMKDQLEPARRKKKGSKEYRSHDNRDSLPFVVQVKTPEPYQSNDDMMQQAKKNTDALNRGKKTPKRNNLIGMDSKLHSNGIAASIYSRKKNGDLYK
ncbi:hypothetical protein THAOC_22140 [Thalassiosira oceanica]|uniref:RxLR effector protein n=1 Tax=Thalassiosira oceanica TaxID=159749 RepID=K0SA28_THAOC|nr:hypothetical protein THAOC_22140 [Thalassiosira oceanica]|eukprot:EJK57781.1 hypothetical protein THAOC_22140 [Thalassiosira oceanica]